MSVTAETYVLRPPGVRAASRLLAALVVAALLALAFSARYGLRGENAGAPDAVAALIEFVAPREAARESGAARVRGSEAPAPLGAASVSSDPGATGAPSLSLAALRCATLEGRRENASLCAGVAQARGQGREIAIAPVEGVLSSDGALQRSILSSVNARARTYALGEAQKYADPREDPLFDDGTDPATAAHRPCAAGVEPRGTGAGLTGRTCQVYR